MSSETTENPSAAARLPELLAPAGDWDSLNSALEAGADAVYFGLTTLNARRRAKNFHQDDFARAVETTHAYGARAYLTLNIDLTERDLGQAARMIELARQCGADAVLVRDPALLALRSAYPELAMHWSTQNGVTSSADVEAAGRLGAARVVLARELALDEVTKASAVPGVETEMFVQGSLCFCVSGRCLLSSWAGGRSGNRGACTSPCRVPWTIDGREAGSPLSMHDLSTVDRLDELRRSGTSGLKIEGRLKNAAWVGRAVELYRRALASDCDPAAREALRREAAELGAYTGRSMTCGYLDARRDDLTGLAGRESTPGAAVQPAEIPAEAGEEIAAASEDSDDDGPGSTFDFSIFVEPRGIACRLQCAGRTDEWTIPKTVVRRAHKAVAIGQVLELLDAGPMHGCSLRDATTNDPEFLMVPRAVNAMVDRIDKSIRRLRKAPSDMIRVELPAAVQALLEKAEPHETNRRKLGDRPDRVRVEAGDVGALTRSGEVESLIVEGVSASVLDRVVTAARQATVVVALPSVFFEAEIPGLEKLLKLCKDARLTVEVNSWGGWRLAQAAGVRIEGGPGLGVLNSLAARALRAAGIRCVTLSIEADRRQLEDVTAYCDTPCSMVVFGRPALLTTRVRLGDESMGKVFEDRRGIRLTARRQGTLTVFRPVRPFDLRDLHNERIRVQHLVVDLVGSDDPLAEFDAAMVDREEAFRFNYDRTLA